MSFSTNLVALAVTCLTVACSPKKPPTSPDAGGVMCTMEAKICPDGSSVGRSGPKCEFAPCPAAAAPADGEAATPTAPDPAVAPTP